MIMRGLNKALRGLPLLLLWLTTACGTPEIQPMIPGAVPWPDGEQSIYEVTAVDGNYAGTATITLTAGAATIAEDGWTVRREVNTQGDQEVVVVEVTAKGLRPRLSTLVRILDTGREQVKASYDMGQVDMELTTVRDVTTTERRNIPSDARDQRTLLLLARMLPLAKGYATQLNSYLPVADLLERVTVAVKGQEQITTPAGVYTCWRLTLSTNDSATEAWIAVEAPHELVKFVDGRNGGTFALRQYQAAP